MKTDYYEDSVPMYTGVAMPRTMFVISIGFAQDKVNKKRNPGILKEYGQRMLEYRWGTVLLYESHKKQKKYLLPWLAKADLLYRMDSIQWLRCADKSGVAREDHEL